MEKQKFPLLSDAAGETLSMAPIINSASLGAVQVGDRDLLVEMTGTDMPSLLLATMIVACDFFDAGYTILPCLVKHPYDTGFGKDLVTPFIFRNGRKLRLRRYANFWVKTFRSKMLSALARTGVEAEERRFYKRTAASVPQRLLHSADVIEDIMLGCELSAFKPENRTILRSAACRP